MTENVVAFAPRRAPCLEFSELRLAENCDLEMTLRDEAGNVVAVLEYALVSKPQDFDLDRLRASWERWRGGSPGLVS